MNKTLIIIVSCLVVIFVVSVLFIFSFGGGSSLLWSNETINSSFPTRASIMGRQPFGDIDNDGDNEFIVAEDTDSSGFNVYAYWYDSTWKSQKIHTFTDEDMMKDLWVGDYYNNGTIYLVSATGGSATTDANIYLMDYKDIGGIITEVNNRKVASVNTNYFHGIYVGDLNSDGYKEIFSSTCSMAGDTGKIVEVKVNETNNSTDVKQQLTKHFGSFAMGDIDNDGIIEVVGSTNENIGSSSSITFYADYNGYENDWANFTQFLWEDVFKGMYMIVIGDADNDGIDEVILMPYASGGLTRNTWIVNFNETGVDSNMTLLTTVNPGAGGSGGVVGDADNDGLNELVIATVTEISGASPSFVEIRMFELNDTSIILNTLLDNISISGYDAEEQANVAIGDADNDGLNEIVFTTRYWVDDQQKIIVYNPPVNLTNTA